MVRDDRRLEEAGKLDPAVAVRRAHHGNLDALVAQSSDTSGPFSFDRGPPFELEAKLAKKINRLSEVIDDDSYVVHPFERHMSNLQGVVWSDDGPFLHAEHERDVEPEIASIALTRDPLDRSRYHGAQKACRR
jgi:hypothetical protein